MLLCLVSHFIDCYVVCHYAKYWNAECHYAQCRHADNWHFDIRHFIVGLLMVWIFRRNIGCHFSFFTIAILTVGISILGIF